jgi:hypothetical protein
LDEIGIPELTSEQLEKLCEITEKAARQQILKEVSLQRITDLNVTIGIEGSKPVTVNVDVKITLSPLMRNYDVQRLVNEAKDRAFKTIEKYLGNLACNSKK